MPAVIIENSDMPPMPAMIAWAEGPVPGEHAIAGLHAVTIWEDGDTGTAAVITQTGGNNTVSNNLYLGNNAGGSGAYNLNGGILSAAGIGVGESGTGEQSAQRQMCSHVMNHP